MALKDICTIFCGNKATVYVLTRLYWNPCQGDYEAFLNKLSRSLITVVENKKNFNGKLVFMAYDDTCQQNENYKRYKMKRDFLLSTLFGKKGEDWMITQEKGGDGSSYAMFKLREFFVSEAKNDNDIAIFLDQDDKLKKDAVKNIFKHMQPEGIVVSPFDTQDENELDINDDSGIIHNYISQRLRKKCYSRKFIKGKCEENICDLSSIGWTKSYTKGVLKRFQTDIKGFMNEKRSGAESFFRNHKAYEDFIDFYVLLYKDINISGIWQKSHTYIKNNESITASPKPEDFTYLRTSMLLALIDLCYWAGRKNNVLCNDFNQKLFRYIASKTCQIESILRKYKEDFHRGNISISEELASLGSDDAFINELCRLANGKTCDETKDTSCSNFNDMIQAGLNIPLYSNTFIARPESPNEILRLAADFESRLRKQKSKKFAKKYYKSNDGDAIVKLMEDYQPPHKKQEEKIKTQIIWTVWLIILTIIVAFIAILLSNDNKLSSLDTFAAAFVTVLVAALTFLLNEQSKMSAIVQEELSTAKLYYSEFQDLIRHVEANLKVMIQVHKELTERKMTSAEDIHFQNLSWPDKSTLFSDDMAKILGRDRVDDYSRLRVNLRNINNSSKWLQGKAVHSEELKDALEWEITRHFGYLVNLYYLKDNKFQFPTSSAILTNFIDEHTIKNRLAGLFMSYESNERMEKALYYLNRYYKDRHIVRAVLMKK